MHRKESPTRAVMKSGLELQDRDQSSHGVGGKYIVGLDVGLGVGACVGARVGGGA